MTPQVSSEVASSRNYRSDRKSDKWLALGVHLLTASGIFVALLAMIAAVRWQWVEMFLWLGLAFFIDGIDGPIARKLGARRMAASRYSGVVLDLVVDYVTYALIPAFVLVMSTLMPGWIGLFGAATILITSALYFSADDIKAPSNAFRGFPAVWNGVVFFLFVLRPDAYVSLTIIVVLAVLSFTRIEFVHPVRVHRLRPVTMTVSIIWSVLAATILAYNWRQPGGSWEHPAILTWGLCITGLYLFLVGAYLQMTAKDRAAS